MVSDDSESEPEMEDSDVDSDAMAMTPEVRTGHLRLVAGRTFVS